MNIKLLASDMDDTLLNHSLDISDANARAIRAAEAEGVRVVLASGRSLPAMETYVRALGLDREGGFIISQNGAQVFRADTLELLYEHSLDASLAQEIVGWAWENEVVLQTNRGREIHATRDNAYSQSDSRATGMPLRIARSPQEFAGDHLLKLVLPGDPDMLTSLEPEIERRWGASIRFFRSKPYFLEIMPPSADKAFALAELAAFLGIGRDQVMAVGDSGNDVEMVSWAGVGVAMANGSAEIKAAADWVTTKDNDNDGLAEAIGRFILEPSKVKLGSGV